MGTTSEFLDYLNLKKLDELPPLSEIKEVDDLDIYLGRSPSPQGDMLEDLSSEPSETEH